MKNKTQVVFTVGDFQVIQHTCGNHRFAVWEQSIDELVCWCDKRETAKRIATSLYSAGSI